MIRPTDLVSTTDERLRDLVVAYLTRRLALRDLLFQSGQLNWELDGGPQPALGATDFVDEVTLALDEYTGGYRREADLRELLRTSLMNTHSLELAPRASRLRMRTSSVSRLTDLELVPR